MLAYALQRAKELQISYSHNHPDGTLTAQNGTQSIIKFGIASMFSDRHELCVGFLLPKNNG